jgi:hypothetical protein
MAGPSLVVDWPVLHAGEFTVGCHEIIIRVTNPGSQPRRVLGMLKVCGVNGCVSLKSEAPVTIPPGEVQSIPCQFEIRTAAHFEVPIHLYIEDDGIREVSVTMRGVGIAPRGQH